MNLDYLPCYYYCEFLLCFINNIQYAHFFIIHKYSNIFNQGK